MSRRIDSLNPDTAQAVRRALGRLGREGVPYFLDSAARLEVEQVAYYAQGREPLEAVNLKRARAEFRPIGEMENHYKITNCDGITSLSAHQRRDAVDVVPAAGGGPVWPPEADRRWRQIAAAFVAEGFRWGGDWDGDGRTRSDGDLDEVFVDFPHYELRRG